MDIYKSVQLLELSLLAENRLCFVYFLFVCVRMCEYNDFFFFLFRTEYLEGFFIILFRH